MMKDFKGAHIFSPSGCVLDQKAFDRGRQWLLHQFSEVTQSRNTLLRDQRFAGSDEQRLLGIDTLSELEGRRFMIASRGGYGLSRLLPRINFEKLAKYLNDSGSVLCGHSDVTVLHLALLAHGVSPGRLLQGPMVCFDLGAEQTDIDMEDWLSSSLSHQAQTIRWFTDKTGHNAFVTSVSASEVSDTEITDTEMTAIHRLAEFFVQGTLWGGNLAMLCSLLGTRFMPSTCGILFLEDVNEPPYRVERMLLQLLHSGVIDRQKAIVLGQFTDWTPSGVDQGYDVRSAVEYVRSQTRVPVVTNLPFGHIHKKLSLPIGVEAILRVYTDHIDLHFPATL